MRSPRVVLGLALALISCSSGASSPPAAATGDAGAGNTGPDCAGEVTSSAPCGSLAWSESDVTSRPRNHHATIVADTPAGPFLYAIGGANVSSTLDNVDAAPIHADGSLGDFVALPAIPRSVGGMTAALVNGVIVIAGGTHSVTVTNTAYSAVVQSDGTLGTWNAAGTIGQFRMHPGSVVSGNTMYVMGGFNDPNVWDDIVSATVSADGTVSAWAPAGKLPAPRSHFAATLHDGYVYLTGGLQKSAFGSPPPLATSFRGRVLEDGTIGEWTPMPDLPVSICTHASFFYGGYVYVGGGLSTTSYKETKNVWRAPIADDHSLGAWEEVSSLTIARGHVHQLPVHGTHVYSVGGALDFNLTSTDVIDIGSFQ